MGWCELKGDLNQLKWALECKSVPVSLCPARDPVYLHRFRIDRSLAPGAGKAMKAVVIGEPSGATMEPIMAVYPRHKEVVDRFIARGEVLGLGPFQDLGNMALFKTRSAAEQFVREDPFIREGLISRFVIRNWNDSLLSD